MAIESDADRAVFVDADDFGVAATYGAYTVDVIFDAGYQEIAGLAGAPPQAQLRNADVTTASIVVGGTIVINSTSYTVRVMEPDGTGMTILRLEEQ